MPDRLASTGAERGPALTVQFDQVEGVQEDAGVVPPVLTISVKRSVRSLRGRPVEPTPRAVLAGDDAKAIVLDFVNTQAAGRQRVALCREARREDTHTQHAGS
jgi:hypothetical protein